MYSFVKTAAAIGVAAILAASVAEPAAARNRWVGPAVGFAAGAIVGSAIVNSYQRPYYYDNGYNAYAYDGYNAYAYDPYNAYAYAPSYSGQVYVQPSYPQYYQPYRQCSPDTNAGRQDAGC